jgi:hypothetical protein
MVMILSFAAEPSPETTRAPRKDSYDVAVACQMFDPRTIMQQTNVTGRRPNTFAQGMMMKFA